MESGRKQYPHRAPRCSAMPSHARR
jgi:hypothetical protein